MNIKHAKYIMTAIALLLCCIIPAKAAPPSMRYQDVPETYPYADEIYACAEEGYVSGVGNNCFEPDRRITLNQYLSVVFRMFYPEQLLNKNDSWSSQVERLAAELKLASTYELYHKQNECNWLWMLEILFDVTDLTVYSPGLLNDDIAIETLSIPDKSLLASASRYGFLDGLQITDPKSVPSRGEMVKLLHNAAHAAPWEPEIVEEFTSIIFLGHQSDYDISKSYETLLSIPKALRKRFMDEKWSLNLSDKLFYEYDPDFAEYAHADGLCSYSKRCIYVRTPFTFNSPNVILHEIAHYLSYTTGVQIPETVFAEEQENLREVIRNYTGTSRDEAFADIAAVYMAAERYGELHPESAELSQSQQMLKALEQHAPKSCDVVRKALEKIEEVVL